VEPGQVIEAPRPIVLDWKLVFNAGDAPEVAQLLGDQAFLVPGYAEVARECGGDGAPFGLAESHEVLAEDAMDVVWPFAEVVEFHDAGERELRDSIEVFEV
jgi:hypothetical protein